MKLDLKARGREDREARVLHFNLVGEDRHRLLGRNQSSPRTLEALERVLQEVLGRRGSRQQVYIDTEDMRAKQTAKLTELADALAQTALRQGRPIMVAGLNDFERRVIHQRVTEGQEVATESDGVGIFRKLRLWPVAERTPRS